MSSRHRTKKSKDASVRRKVEFKLYPSKTQERLLYEWLELHRGLYNDALAERREAFQQEGRRVCYLDQQNALPAFKAEHPEYKALGSHALQETLRRLDRAFAAFFRRCREGVKKKGYPRFKGHGRLKSFTYPDPAGWSLEESEEHPKRAHRLRVSGLGTMRVRGKHRFQAQPGSYKANDLTIFRRGRKFYASVTLRVSEEGCGRERTADGERGFDLGLESLLTFDDGETIANPRWMRSELMHLRQLQRERSRKYVGSSRYSKLSYRIAKTHERIERKRRDSLHKLSATLVAGNRLLATEELSVAQMSASGGAYKKGLNREILSAGWSTLLGMVSTKAEEAGSRFHVAPTRQLKPSQRCSHCWSVGKKSLWERRHECPCGARLGRDENAALVCLLDARAAIGSGIGPAARERPLGESDDSSKVAPNDPRNRSLQESLAL